MVDPLQEERAQGTPDARCTRGLVRKYVRRNAHEHTGSAEAIRHSLRNGFTAYNALSSATNSFLSPSPRGSMVLLARLDQQHLRGLDISNGCQDHTTSPYASAPFVCTPVDRSQLPREQPCHHHWRADAAASIASPALRS